MNDISKGTRSGFMVVAFLGLGLVVASAQRRLSPGESFTFQFDTIPYAVTFPPSIVPPSGGAACYLDQALSPSVSPIRLEMFEGSTSETPIADVTGNQDERQLNSLI